MTPEERARKAIDDAREEAESWQESESFFSRFTPEMIHAEPAGTRLDDWVYQTIKHMGLKLEPVDYSRSIAHAWKLLETCLESGGEFSTSTIGWFCSFREDGEAEDPSAMVAICKAFLLDNLLGWRNIRAESDMWDHGPHHVG